MTAAAARKADKTALAKTAAKPVAKERRGPGRPAENRPDRVSLYMLIDGTWLCQCGHKNKIEAEVCRGKVTSGGLCALPQPKVRFTVAVPMNIAINFARKAKSKGIGFTPSLTLAINEWLAKE